MREFVVKIGKEFCVVESLNPDKLYCRPPEDQPESANGGFSNLPLVEVTYRVLLSIRDYC